MQMPYFQAKIFKKNYQILCFHMEIHPITLKCSPLIQRKGVGTKKSIQHSI